MDDWVKANQSKVKGKIVLMGKAAEIPVNFDPPAKRRDDEQVKAQYDPNNPNAGRGRGGFGGAAAVERQIQTACPRPRCRSTSTPCWSLAAPPSV
jgi:hypothetical protein